jgi:hypothetical protein
VSSGAPKVCFDARHSQNALKYWKVTTGSSPLWCTPLNSRVVKIDASNAFCALYICIRINFEDFNRWKNPRWPFGLAQFLWSVCLSCMGWRHLLLVAAIRCSLVAFRLNYFSYKVPICALSSSYQPQSDGQLDCHTSTKMIPSEVVYGQMPPTVLFSYSYIFVLLMFILWTKSWRAEIRF